MLSVFSRSLFNMLWKKIIWGKKHIIVTLYLSQHDCQCFCKSQNVSLMREHVANWFNFSRHNAIFLPKLQTVFAILNILQSVLWNNLFDFTKQGLIYICLLTFITQVEHFKKDFTYLKMQFETECECIVDGNFSDYRGRNHWFPSTERNTSSLVEGEVGEIFTTDFHPRSF